MRRLKLLFTAFALLLGWSNAMAQKDVTSQYITNATLSNGTTGWTNVNFNNPVQGNNTTGFASECYAGWGSLEKTNYSQVVLAGGVAANSEIRKKIFSLRDLGYKVYAPAMKYCTDNASMVASAAVFFENTFDDIDVEVFSRVK